MAPIELDYVQHLILFDAADIANQMLFEEEGDNQSPLYRTHMSGQIFNADPLRSEKGGLTLSIEAAALAGTTPEGVQRLRQIGKQAIHDALIKNQGHFVGLILGEARRGRNYFDRFDPPAQSRLF